MFEGDRKITLLEPTAPVVGALGGEYEGDPTRHVVWARRLDRGGYGGRKAQIGAEFTEWTARFQVRYTASLRTLSAKWQLIDERDRTHDVEGVAEDGKLRSWLIYAVARD